MAEITASMVKELRERTGLGMMECKKALGEADGDLKKAEDLMRIKSGAKANKAASRIAAEGVIGSFISADGKVGALVELNSETDFVAKNDEFAALAKETAKLVADQNPADLDAVSNLKLGSGQTVEEARKALVMKLGENMTLRRMARFSTAGHLSVYLHGTKIGVMVDMQGGDEALGKDLAMQIAAAKPMCVSRDQVSADVIAREAEIAKARAVEAGKPDNLLDKIVEGSINKFMAENTLLGQIFVKDEKFTIEKLLASKNAKVNNFQMFIVGEGIEKKVVDFAAEVAAAGQV